MLLQREGMLLKSSRKAIGAKSSSSSNSHHSDDAVLVAVDAGQLTRITDIIDVHASKHTLHNTLGFCNSDSRCKNVK